MATFTCVFELVLEKTRMKKTLIAMAVLGATSGAAFAADSVQLYGTLDLAATHSSYSNGGTSATSLTTGSWANSSIGVKGSESLGGGLTASFKAETGFCGNGGGTGSGTKYGAVGGPGTDQYCTGGGFMGRTSMVSLSGGFGTVSAGRMYTFSDGSVGAVDPTGNSGLGSASALVLADNYFRQSQMLAYSSPTIAGGLTLNAGYMFGDGAPYGTPLTKTTGGYNLNATYAAGPVVAGLDYLRQDSTNGAVTGAAIKSTMLFGSYDFGVVKLGGLISQNKPDAGISATSWSGSDKVTNWMLGASAPVGGNGSAMLAYTQFKDNADATKNAGLWNLAYTYSLSKRTTLYAYYARLANKANGAATFVYTYVPATAPAVTGYTGQAVSLGMVTTF